MTKIPVTEECELFARMKTVDELIKDAELEMKRLDIKHRKRSAILMLLAMAYLAIVSFNGLITTHKLLSLFDTNPDKAQCESIGGRYDGSQCWYNGSVIDVNKYVEEWK